MSFDSAAVVALFDAVKSHAMQLGIFERVNQHEPKNAPGNGLSCSIWTDVIEPLPDASGLAQTSGRVAFHVRIMGNMLPEPQDDIDHRLYRVMVITLPIIINDLWSQVA